jgi:hypothetical protein
MVELDRSPDDVEGTLTLEDRAVRFAPSDGTSAREIDLTDIHRVKRVWGSPILMVHSVEDGARHVAAFYFSKPPPLHPNALDPGEPPPTLMGPFNRDRPPSRRKQRRSNAGYLASTSNLVIEELRAWAKETRAAVTAARADEA